MPWNSNNHKKIKKIYQPDSEKVINIRKKNVKKLKREVRKSNFLRRANYWFKSRINLRFRKMTQKISLIWLDF